MTTPVAKTNALQSLQDWYLAQCNGDWEHTYGVSIGTLDNPGWTLDVEQLLAEILFESLIGFSDQAGHGWAAAAFALELMLLEDFFQPFGVFLSLFRVALEALRKFRRGNFAGKLRERFDELLLGIVEILEIREVNLLQTVVEFHMCPVSVCCFWCRLWRVHHHLRSDSGP